MNSTLRLALFLLLCVPAFAQADRPASVISVTDAYLPYQVVLDGFVILDISLDSRGSITAIRVLRDPGSMVSSAISSVRTWTFEPAIGDNKAQPSDMTVVFVYRPADYGGSKAVLPIPFAPVLPHSKNEAQTPAGILSVAYPKYPVNSVASGSVIVQASLDKAGAVKQAEVVRGQKPFTAISVESLKEWRFQPAMLRGKPTESNVTVAFVFQSPSN
jgi:outer membrane biosynthesis protein TonB